MSWKDNYRFGTLMLMPPGDISDIVDNLRARYDPESHRTCVAHVSLTQPLLDQVTGAHIETMRDVAGKMRSFEIQYGPVGLLGSTCVIYKIKPSERVILLRNKFHEIGLFNLSLPYTDGFIPHMTISEGGIQDVENVLPILNSEHSIGSFTCKEVFHLVPNRDFIFEVRNVFQLSIS
ncbi:MAG: 2'-5' RNA ligase family protein [bacterium]|nr:2'-5' RNA ligase family protein [bacterium]